MKKLLLVLVCLLVSVPAFGADFVSPIGFEPNESNKKAVVEYIKYEVKKTYTQAGMNSESVHRMMEQENLKAFKQLLGAKDKDVLGRVIKQYCGIGMCNYSTILMMYTEEMKAKGQNLSW